MLIVFAVFLSVQMRSNFLGPSKTARKNIEKSGNIENLNLEDLGKPGNFFERNPESSVEVVMKLVSVRCT